MMRIGHGYDVHRLVKGRDLILGGVRIDYALGLEGHSDADVVTHALMDAILGALREGDIGRLFPEDDPTYLGADSIGLLQHVTKKVQDHGATILDCDCTIAAQAPRLSPYRDKMRHNLAQAMSIDIDNVGMKATTTEHLGFVGRGEGIEAWAVVLLDVPKQFCEARPSQTE